MVREYQLPDQTSDNIVKVYSALGNPYRRQIVHILREKGKAGFKELHGALGISIGALYHHLEMLEGIIAQGPDKKYTLAEMGRSAVDALSISEERMTTGISASPAVESRLGFLTKEVLFGRTLFHYLNQDVWRSLPLAFLIVIVGGLVSFETNLEPVLLFYLNPSRGLGQPWLLALFPLGWLATFGISDALTMLVFHRRGGELGLLNGTALSMLPLLVVPGLFIIAQTVSANVQAAAPLIIILQVLVQVWVVCLLSSAISSAKGLRMERTALIGLGVMYLNITVLIVTLQLRLF